VAKYKIWVAENRILIKERVYEEQVKLSIALPESAKDKYQDMATEGRILALGESAFSDIDVLRRPKIGDIIYFQKFDGFGIRYKDVNYRILTDDCHLCFSHDYIDKDEDLCLIK